MALSIAIVSEFNGAGIQKAVKEFRNLETSSQRANYAIRKAAVPATAAIGALATASFEAAQKASDLNEQTSKTNVVFGNAAKAVVDFSKKAATQIGQSQTEALKAAGTFGVLGKAAGLSGASLGKFATDFTVLASDLASFNNTSPEEAVMAIGAALRGEAEPIRRYGVLLNDATLKNKALELGLIKTTKGALDPQTKSLAAQAVILEQTKDAQGDFARTSDGLANSQRILKARLDDAVTSLGQAFLPILEKIVPVLTKMADFAAQNASLIGAMSVAVGAFAGVIVAARVAMAAWKAVAVITTGVNWALASSYTAVQVATGIGIATALAGAAAFVIIKKKMDKARESANQYAQALPPIIDSQKALNDYIGPVATRDFTKFRSGVTDTIPTVKDFGKETKKVADSANKMRDAIKEAKDAVRKDMADALDAAKAKVKDAQHAFDDFGRSVGKALTESYSFKDAYNDAQDTGGGFLKGLTSQTTKIKKFGDLVKRLISQGLSERNLQQVLDAGVDAGTAIAEELLNGAGAILEANKLTAEIDALAKDVGLDASNKFYKAGVDAANAMLTGLQKTIAETEIKLNMPGLTLNQVKGIGADFSNATQPSSWESDFNDWVAKGMPGFSVEGIGVPMFANGGIVTQPTLGMVGEAGPEAIIPLDQMASMGGTNVTIHVNGGDPNAVVSALRTYMRQNGSIPIRVSNIY